MKILSVVGARPNFMKIAPIIQAIARHNTTAGAYDSDAGVGHIGHVLVHTGQHYDSLMSDSFFADLELPAPDVHLGVGSGSQAVQTAEIMKKFEYVLLEHRPDTVIVVGDVNSTLACALVAAKISSGANGWRPRIAHVEAGLRSFDRTMPEEINRILTDHVSDFLFVTEESGLCNLAREGVPSEKVHFVGNTMIDSLMACTAKADASRILDNLGLRARSNGSDSDQQVSPYALLTLHRPANVDERNAFVNILGALDDLTRTCTIVFPAHPRTQKRISEFGLDGAVNSTLRVVNPLGYIDFLSLMKNASIVITDSGGIQEETTYLGVPCVTVRENTERPITIECGTNLLAGVLQHGIRAAICRQLGNTGRRARPKMWDGRSAGRIIDVLVRAVVATEPTREAPTGGRTANAQM
jgi:UDP-N-acetylglucosamine 2-epimerase (non-hydrolysing)